MPNDTFPESYKDQRYAQLDSGFEQKYSLPVGLVSAIREHGEKTDASRVSSSGARTPYQFIPETRNSIRKQYGIDVYLNPENASEGAAILLRDSLKRNGGDEELAIREYHGGVDPKNWGPINNAYLARVSAGRQPVKEAALSAGFQKFMQENPATPLTSQPPQNTNKDALAEGFGQFLQSHRPASEVINEIPGMLPDAALQADPTLGEKIVGAGEAGLSTLTGATTGALGMVAGAGKGLAQSILNGTFGTQDALKSVEQAAADGAEALTYAPKTQAGQNMTQAIGKAVGELLPLAPIAGGIAPALSSAGDAATLAKNAVLNQTVKSAQSVKNGAQQIVERGRQAVGMEGKSANASAGAAATPEELQRMTTAESLPVPVKLTKGAATRDAAELAFEKEQLKGPLGAPLRNRAEENNLQALQNFDAVIDSIDPKAYDIASTGNTVTRALSNGYKAAKNRTNVAYQAARNSEESKLPVDISKPVSIGEGEGALTGSLTDYLNSKVSGVPSAAVTDAARKIAVKMGIAVEDAEGNLIARPTTVGKLEDFRKEISGTAKWDDRIGLRDETILKKIIDANTEPLAGPLYKTARQTRQSQAIKYENRAVVARLVNTVRGMDDPKVAADQVFSKSILNSSPDEITFLKRVLNTTGEDGQQAWKELQAATIRHIRDEATKGLGMDSANRPIISTAKLNSNIQALDKNGRLDIVLGKKQAQTFRDLNDVLQYINTVPPGTLVNSSGTTGTLLTAIGEAGATGFFTGLPVPLISILKQLRQQIKNKQINQKITRALNEKPTEKKL